MSGDGDLFVGRKKPQGKEERPGVNFIIQIQRRRGRSDKHYNKVLFSFLQNSKTLQDFPSHRIF